MELNPLITEKNSKIWEDINKHFHVKVTIHKKSHFYIGQTGDKVIIKVPPDATVELFSKQILHLHLRVQGIYITEWLVDEMLNNPSVAESCDQNLFEQVGNFLEEMKILRTFLLIGFDRSGFSEDYDIHVCTQQDMQLIRSGLQKQVPSLASVNLYMNKFFAMMADPNPEHDYLDYVDEMRTLNKELFHLLEKFSWDFLRIDQPDEHEYKNVIASFMKELGGWLHEMEGSS